MKSSAHRLTRPLTNPIKNKLNEFFARRSPRKDTVSLGLRNVYIFFSRQGLLFALLLIATFVTGVNYGNNLVLGLCFYLFGIWLVTVFYTFVQVASIDVRFVESSLSEAGSIGYVTLELFTRSGKASRQIEAVFGDKHEIIQKMLKRQTREDFMNARTVITPTLGKSVLVRLPVYTPTRGVMTLPRLVISSRYPLGVMRAWAYVYLASPIFVYPKPTSFDWQNDKRAVASESDERSAISVAGQSDFEMLDEYQEGESLARVSWSHAARGAGMLTKHFDDSLGREWCLHYDDMPSGVHETRLSELTHAVQAIASQGAPFMLVLPSGAGQISVGDEFVRQCLLRLAKEP